VVVVITGLEVFLRHAVEQAEVKNALAGLLTSAGVDIRAAVDSVRDDLGRRVVLLRRNPGGRFASRAIRALESVACSTTSSPVS
jgi:hypothetical protein